MATSEIWVHAHKEPKQKRGSRNMTQKTTKSVICTAVMATLVLLAMGLDESFAEHETDRLLEDFGELLDAAEASLSTTQGEILPTPDTSDTIHTEEIVFQTAYLEAFEEVIHKQIL